MPLEVGGCHSSNANGAKSSQSNIKDGKTSNAVNEKEALCMKLKELALKSKLVGPSSDRHENYTPKVKDIWPRLVGQSSADREDESVVKDATVEPNGSSSNKKEDGPKLSEDHSVIAEVI